MTGAGLACFVVVAGASKAMSRPLTGAIPSPHGGGGNAEFAGHGLHFVVVHPAQALLGLAQVEEQLALRLGGGDLDDAPVAQDELVHLGADPVHRKGHQAHALVRIEALDRLHQADVAFLDQVGNAAGRNRNSRGQRERRSAEVVAYATGPEFQPRQRRRDSVQA
jgi:hypothetical protein